MIVVSDTTPLNYLLLIGALHILPSLYGRIEIPEAVHQELSAPGAPDVVRMWASRLPEWMSVRRVDGINPSGRLHAGEAEAIALAVQRHADLVLLDDWAARTAAKSQGLAISGTVGILAIAADRGLVDLPMTVERLKATSFQASPKLFDALLKQANPPR